MRGAMLAAAASVCLGTPALADELPTGRDLYDWCTAKAGSMSDTLCSMYITGYTHGANATSNRRGPFCLPNNIAPVEVRAAYIRAVRTMRQSKRPDILDDKPMDLALGAALFVIYPCPKTEHSPE